MTSKIEKNKELLSEYNRLESLIKEHQSLIKKNQDLIIKISNKKLSISNKIQSHIKVINNKICKDIAKKFNFDDFYSDLSTISCKGTIINDGCVRINNEQHFAIANKFVYKYNECPYYGNFFQRTFNHNYMIGVFKDYVKEIELASGFIVQKDVWKDPNQKFSDYLVSKDKNNTIVCTIQIDQVDIIYNLFSAIEVNYNNLYCVFNTISNKYMLYGVSPKGSFKKYSYVEINDNDIIEKLLDVVVSSEDFEQHRVLYDILIEILKY